MVQETGQYSQALRSLMDSVEISSYKALARMAGVSEWQVRQLRRGKATQMRLENLLKLAQALDISVDQLIESCSDVELSQDNSSEALKQEYDRLRSQLKQQKQTLWQEFQRQSLDVLEPWMLQWPTVTHAVEKNPQLPAERLLPQVRPVEKLLKTWNIEAIAPVGAEVPYDPQQHQLMEGTAEAGQTVRVRYTGYKQGDRLLYRAKVSPV